MLLTCIDEHVAQPDMAYNAGYSACANEALRHIAELDNVSVAARQRLIDGLSVHLQRSTVTTDRPVTSPSISDVTVAPRRLFESPSMRCDEGRCQETARSGRRRPLADIQPSIRRDPPSVCRSKMAAAAASITNCRLPFQFPPDVASHSGHVMADEFGPATSTQVVSRCVTMTQTMTTTLQEDQETTTQASDIDVESNNRCSSADAELGPMWRPW